MSVKHTKNKSLASLLPQKHPVASRHLINHTLHHWHKTPCVLLPLDKPHHGHRSLRFAITKPLNRPHPTHRKQRFSGSLLGGEGSLRRGSKFCHVFLRMQHIVTNKLIIQKNNARKTNQPASHPQDVFTPALKLWKVGAASSSLGRVDGQSCPACHQSADRSPTPQDSFRTWIYFGYPNVLAPPQTSQEYALLSAPLAFPRETRKLGFYGQISMGYNGNGLAQPHPSAPTPLSPIIPLPASSGRFCAMLCPATSRVRRSLSWRQRADQ